jgi:hypothetical protein
MPNTGKQICDKQGNTHEMLQTLTLGFEIEDTMRMT